MHLSLSFGTRNFSLSRFKSWRDPGHRHWVVSWRWLVVTFGYYHADAAPDALPE